MWVINILTVREPGIWRGLAADLTGRDRFRIEAAHPCAVWGASCAEEVAQAVMPELDKRQRVGIVSDGWQGCGDVLPLLLSRLSRQGIRTVSIGSGAKVDGAEDVGVVLGIGPNTALSRAKLVATEVLTTAKLMLMPTSLATDSFLTNKYRQTDDRLLLSSRSGRYPDIVIIPWWIIRRAPNRVNLAGVGEALAICSAVSDLLYLGYKDIPDSTAEEVEAIATWASWRLKCAWDTDSLLSTIFALLVVKCLVMWAFGDCRWGAGSEHKIAYALGDLATSQLMHGEACAFGTWLMCSRFFRQRLGDLCLACVWEAFEQAQLPLTCNAVGIDKKSLPALLRRAKNYRPSRRCYLDTLSDKEMSQMEFWET